MANNRIKLSLLFIAGMLIAQAVCATSTQQTTSTQQKGMDDNLEDAIPSDDLKEQQDLQNPRIVIPEKIPSDDLKEQQDLQNPRIVIPENLQEMPEIRAVSSDDPDSSFTQKTKEELKELEEELQLEAVDKSKKLLDKTDRLMEVSRRPSLPTPSVIYPGTCSFPDETGRHFFWPPGI